MATYSYTKYIDDDRLSLEIRNSAIVTALSSVDLTGENTFNVIFKATLSSKDKQILDDLVLAHVNIPLTVRDSVEIAGIDITSNAEKALKVSPTKLEGSSTQMFSHDFCDATTWWYDSVRVNETLTTLDKLTFKSTETNWIDLTHGKVPYEDRIASGYAPIVKVNGVKVTEGFEIDYQKGTVKFASAQTGTVSADFSYATTSTWVMAPSEGKILKILGTKVKFTGDVVMAEGQHIAFQLYVAGQPYGQTTVYKNVKDLIKCADGLTTSQGFGDVSNEVNTLSFEYITSKDIKNEYAMEIRIWISNHKPISGEFGIVTADCLSV